MNRNVLLLAVCLFGANALPTTIDPLTPTASVQICPSSASCEECVKNSACRYITKEMNCGDSAFTNGSTTLCTSDKTLVDTCKNLSTECEANVNKTDESSPNDTNVDANAKIGESPDKPATAETISSITTDVATTNNTDDLNGTTTTINSTTDVTTETAQSTSSLSTAATTETTISTVGSTDSSVSTETEVTSESTVSSTDSSTSTATKEDTPDTSGRRFDPPSFIGGIVLALGLLAIAYVGYKFYRARTEHNYHTLHETVHM